MPETASCHQCGHPLTAHTETDDTFPFAVCARMIETDNEYRHCGCELWCRIVRRAA